MQRHRTAVALRADPNTRDDRQSVWRRDVKHGIQSSERIGQVVDSQRVRHPFAVDDQAVFVATRRQTQLLDPASIGDGDHGRGCRMPFVECSGHENGGGGRAGEFQSDIDFRHVSTVAVMVAAPVAFGSFRHGGG